REDRGEAQRGADGDAPDVAWWLADADHDDLGGVGGRLRWPARGGGGVDLDGGDGDGHEMGRLWRISAARSRVLCTAASTCSAPSAAITRSRARSSSGSRLSWARLSPTRTTWVNGSLVG